MLELCTEAVNQMKILKKNIFNKNVASAPNCHKRPDFFFLFSFSNFFFVSLSNIAYAILIFNTISKYIFVFNKLVNFIFILI